MELIKCRKLCHEEYASNWLELRWCQYKSQALHGNFEACQDLALAQTKFSEIIKSVNGFEVEIPLNMVALNHHEKYARIYTK